MLRFLVARVVEAVVLLLIMSFIIYGLIGLMPGDPIDLMIASDPRLSSLDAERLRRLHGLDLPIWERYVNWLGDAVQGEFGYARLHGKPVMDVLIDRLGNTLTLMISSFTIAILIALPAGIIAALRPHSLTDNIINLMCFGGISIPPFWLALLFMMVFAVVLGWLPPGGMGPTTGEDGFFDRLPYMVLPVATLSLASVGHYTRFMRASMMETLRQDYIRTAKAKGAQPTRVVLRHALRNALIPVVTVIALQFGTLFSGALITETMFSYLGMGKTIHDAIMGNDYNLALVGLLFATLMVIASNLLADVTYALLDPRISYR